MPTEQITLRASALPRIIRCPGSAILPQIATTSLPARLGTVVHEACEFIIRGETPNLEHMATLHDVPVDELRRLYYSALALWDAYGDFYPNPKTEVELSQEFEAVGYTLTGHADIISYPGDGTLRIADWKTGYKDGDFMPQLKTYAALAYLDALEHDMVADDLGGMPLNIERVNVCVFWLRNRETEAHWFEVKLLREWLRMITETVELARTGELVVGEQCRYCPVANCPALKSGISLFSQKEPFALTNENAFETYELIGAVERRCKDMKATIENHVRNNGSVSVEDGRTLGFSPRVTETITLNPDAIKVLEKTITGNDILEIAKVSKEALGKKIGATVTSGKGKAIQAVHDELRKVGAITTSETETFGIKRG